MFTGGFVNNTKICCKPGEPHCNEINLKEINYPKIAFCILYIIAVAVYYSPNMRRLAIYMKERMHD